MYRTTCLATIFLFFVANIAWGVVQYTVTDLGTLDGFYIEANSINNTGQVVGICGLHAFRTIPNQPINPETHDLGTLGGPASWAYGINENGQIVGNAETSDNSIHAFRTVANHPINPATDDLGTFGGTYSFANGINNIGQVVGAAETSDEYYFAFRTSPNQPINPLTDNLGTLGGPNSIAYAINNNGQVAGQAEISSSNFDWHAFRTAPSQSINPATDDLGTLGGTYSQACSINDSGQVVGRAYTSDYDSTGNPIMHAFCTAANKPINPTTDDLGTFGGTYSCANDINENGCVVGISSTNNSHHAFIYSGNGPMQDLNDMIDPSTGWELQEATGINDRGQIVGQGRIGYELHSFLLTPVPEPSSLLLLIIGFISLIAYTKQRRES
jgi:probable HAF family extracellular repeat protein